MQNDNLHRTRWIFAILFCFGLLSQPQAQQDQQHWVATSTDGLLKAQLQMESGHLGIGKYQQWRLTLLDTNEQAVFPAQIRIGGGMPAHGHGLPTQPQISAYLGDGAYLIEGMKFTMAGDWIMLFEVDSAEFSTQVQFDINIPY